MFNKNNLAKTFAGLTAASMLLSSAAFAQNTQKTVTATYNNIKIAVDEIKVTPKDVNGNIVDPFIIDGTTYLPVRALANALGQGVSWDQETNTVIIGGEPEVSSSSSLPTLQQSGKGRQTVEVTTVYKDIKIVVNGTQITPTDVNGNIVEPFIIDGTTYLPVRALANALGENVSWEQSTSTVYIGRQPFRVNASILKQFSDKTLMTVGNTAVKGAYFNLMTAQNCNNSSFPQICDNYEEGKTLQDLTMDSVPVAKVLCDFITENIIPVVAVYEYALQNDFMSKANVSASIDAIFEGNLKQFSTESEYKGFLAECGITAEDYEQFLKMSSIYSLFSDDLYSRYLSIPYTEDELRQISGNRYITAKHILVEKQDTAMEIIKKLESGTSFDELSDQYNIDPGASSAGYTFTEGQMVPEFEEAAYALKENSYTKNPVKSSYGYHIIKRLPLDTDWIDMNRSEVIQVIASADTYAVLNKIIANAKVDYTDYYTSYVNTIK